MEKRILTSSEEIVLQDDGIILCTVLDNVHLSLEQAKENIEAVKKLNTSDQPCKVIVDIRNAKGVSQSARQYFTEPELALIQGACALIVESRISVIMGNFFTGMNKPAFPLKLFKSIEAGRIWLNELK